LFAHLWRKGKYRRGSVGAEVAAGVMDGPGVDVAVGVGDGPGVAVLVGVDDGPGVAVLVGVAVHVGVKVGVVVGVGVGVGGEATVTQAENSEVSPPGSIAVAVRLSPTDTAAARLTTKLA